ncbi:MAG: large subunit ribosomal protein L18 [Alphaproteobacteria bacterium]
MNLYSVKKVRKNKGIDMSGRFKTELKRKLRVRRAVKRRSGDKCRLSVFRSSKNIYAQIIDDKNGITLASASTLEKDLKSEKGSDKTAAENIGKLIAERGKKAGVEKVVFDRGPYLFHGRVKALAEAARNSGLEF